MDALEMTVLDVGHGSCSLVIDGQMTFVVDTPLKNRMLNLALADKGITSIDAILISHGDADHVGGVLSLLTNSSIKVDRVYLNPEMERDSEAWEDLREALKDARKRGETVLTTSLTTNTEEEVQLPRLAVEILAPFPENAMSGAGGTSVGGKKLESNTMSAVIRFKDRNSRGVLVAGDVDRTGLDEAISEAVDLEADILVFPHHGGLPGRSHPEGFAREIMERVKPSMVVFSQSRKSGLPRREILQGIKDGGAKPHIACTQLSKNCASALPDADRPYLSELSQRGGTTRRCCAGPVEIFFTRAGLYSPQLEGHADFVSGLKSALCQS